MSQHPYYADEAVTLYHGDCRSIIPTLSAVACVITDPPYQSLDVEVGTGTSTRLVGRDQFSGKRLAASDGAAWFATLSDDDVLAVIGQCRSVLLPTGALYVFADVKSGLRLFAGWARNVIVWDKQQIGMGYAWRRCHEWIAYQPMDGHVLRDKSLGDIIRCGIPRDKVHPTEKPMGVLTPVILNSTDPGDAILDPFAGSGTTGVAAKVLGRKAILIELSEAYCEIAAKRLSQGALFSAGDTPLRDAVDPVSRDTTDRPRATGSDPDLFTGAA